MPTDVLYAVIGSLVVIIGFMIKIGGKATYDGIKNELAEDRQRNNASHKELCQALKGIQADIKDLSGVFLLKVECRQLIETGACQVGQLKVLEQLARSTDSNNAGIHAISDLLAQHGRMYQQKMKTNEDLHTAMREILAAQEKR
jgi:hypothetical protein